MKPLKQRLVQLKHDNSILVVATVSLDGKPLVDLYQSHETEISLRPIEAERLARALLDAARSARKKVQGKTVTQARKAAIAEAQSVI